MKKKILLIISIVSGAIALLALVYPLITPLVLKADYPEASSIGIIGGADGPTVIFVSENFKQAAFRYGFAVICSVITAVTAVLFHKSNKEGKNQ